MIQAFTHLMDNVRHANWKYINQGDLHRPTCLLFWCKAGKHRSYALLVFFLMFAAHVHDPNLVQVLLNRRLDGMRPEAEMCRAHQSRCANMRNTVMFGDLAADFTDFLNDRFPNHHLY